MKPIFWIIINIVLIVPNILAGHPANSAIAVLLGFGAGLWFGDLARERGWKR